MGRTRAPALLIGPLSTNRCQTDAPPSPLTCGTNSSRADSSERRNIEAMWRLRWELGGRLDVV